MSLVEIARAWLAQDPDPNTRAEVERLITAADQTGLADRFGTRLAFGTAGLRGLFGAGPNRMNRLVVRQTTSGLAAYLLEHINEAGRRGVVVGYDGRRQSREFARDTASVLAGYGIVVHLFDRELPTPLTAFAVKEYGAAAGVMITASHNPPDYNGYKVYWENGAQIISPIDEGIAFAIEKAAKSEILWRDCDGAARDGIVRTLGSDSIEAYLKAVRALSVHPVTPARGNMVIAYTPMHGVGAAVTETALARAGFTKVHTVAEQRLPDGEFPTVKFPNPEEPGAMDLAIALATKVKADLVMANDPDADRLAVGLPHPSGGYRMLTGDQVGVLLGDDLIAAQPKNAVVGCSIVSSRMLGLIARARGADHFETLTGFKWIANAAIAHRARGRHFVFGYEEALGYTIGELVRDKDGVSAVVAFAELAASCAERGETLWQRLEKLYREHGLFLTMQKSLALKPGASVGAALRANPPRQIGRRAVVRTLDFATATATTHRGDEEPIDLPKSDVLIYLLEDDARVIVRPSGTEPKLKCYYEVRETVAAGEPIEQAEGRAKRMLDELAQQHGATLSG